MVGLQWKVHFIHTQTHKNWRLSYPHPCNAETQNEFYGKGSLIPRDALACGAFLRPLCPAQYHGSNEGCIKMRALGSFHGMGCSPLRFECETPTQWDLYTGNLNLTLINKIKRLFTPKNSNTGSFTYEGQSIIYIHTARGGRATTRELIISHNYRSTISGSLERVALLLPLKYTYNSQSRAPHWMACEERARQEGGKITKLKMNPVRPHHPLAHKNASMKLIWTIFLF